MATHTSVESFVGALRALPHKVEAGRNAAVAAGALHVTTHIRKSIRAASGGDNRLSGVGSSGAKVGARYDIKGTRNPTALITAQGPLHLIERATKPHVIPRTLSARRLRTASGRLSARREVTGRSLAASARRPLNIGGRIVTGPVRHPGTRGQYPFAKGVAAALPTVGRVMHQAWRKAVF